MTASHKTKRVVWIRTLVELWGVCPVKWVRTQLNCDDVPFAVLTAYNYFATILFHPFIIKEEDVSMTWVLTHKVLI